MTLGTNKVNFYIDGFNFYHKIKRYQELRGICLKWLNYDSLCRSFLKPQQQLNKIYFFTATTNHFGSGSSERHETYIKALKSKSIEIVQGYFKYDPVKKRLEEKQTDSNIVAHLIEGAFTNQYDTALILSGDSDIVPAVRIIKRNKEIQDKIVGFIPPPFSGKKNAKNPLSVQNTSALNQICDFQKNLSFETVAKHLFPDKIYDASGKLIVEIPWEYKNN
jgi:uncharacterized LabA/DUF88 family protein